MIYTLFLILQFIFLSWFTFLILWPRTSQLALKQYNLAFSIVVLMLVLVLGVSSSFATVTDVVSIFNLNFLSDNNTHFSLNYTIAVDSLAYLFMLLTALLIPLCMLSAWNNIKFKLAEFMLTVAMVEWMLLNMFMVSDLLLFYI